MRSALVRRLVFSVLLVCSACPQRSAAPSFDASAAPPKVAHVVVATGPFTHEAPRLIGHWRDHTGWPHGTLALLTGISAVNDPLSALFDGIPTAALARAANVAAFTAGPRDVDLGLSTLVTLRDEAGAMPLLANVRETGGPVLAAPTSAVFERDHVRIGVIGISTLTKADGPFEALPLEGALATTIESTAKQADVVVVLVSGCSTDVRRLFEAHKDWKADLVVASACEGQKDGRVGTTMFLHPATGQYASLRVEVGAVRSLSAQVVDVPSASPEEPDAAKVRDGWLGRKQELEARPLTVVKDTPDLERSALAVATALRVVAKVDAGLFSTTGLKKPFPGGAVTRGQVLDALPSYERVFLVDVPGEVLTKLVSHPDAFLSLPAKVDPNGAYVLATTESLYRVGIGLEAVDANPIDSDLLLPKVVTRWLEEQPATADKPLLLPAKPAKRR